MPQGSLEQEALDRVARMYSSFDRRVNNRPRSPAPPAPKPPEPEPPEPVEPPAVEPQKPAGLLDVLLRDKEQSLIMLLLVILMRDGADLNVILALMYLLI